MSILSSLSRSSSGEWLLSKGSVGADIQTVIDHINTEGVAGRDVNPRIVLPAGLIQVSSTITIPVTASGLEIVGSGYNETTTLGTRLRNTGTGPLFKTTSTGSMVFFRVSRMRLEQAATSGHCFEFNHLSSFIELDHIHAEMSNPAASVVFTNGVEVNTFHVHHVRAVTANPSVPLFKLVGPSAGSGNVVMIKFNNMITLGKTGSAPHFLIAHDNPSGSPSVHFSDVLLEAPDGGGIHCVGISSVNLTNVVAADADAISAPTILIDRFINQKFLSATLTECYLPSGNTTFADLEIANTAGTPGVPGPVTCIGGRINFIKTSAFTQLNAIGTDFGGESTGHAGNVTHLYQGALMGLKGQGASFDPTGSAIPRWFGAIGSFNSSDTANISLATDPELNIDYEIELTPYANETIWVDRASKTTTSFNVMSSNSSSTASFLWRLVRP